jgi:arginase family enzyme
MAATIKSSGLSKSVTFLGASLVSPSEAPSGAVAFSGAPNDSSPTERVGAALGPRIVREASLLVRERLDLAGPEGLIDVDTGTRLSLPSVERLVDVGDFTMYPADLAKTTESIAHGVYQVARRGAFSVCMGGDHYISYPSALGYCRAAAERRHDVRIGYIHIDGHLDFESENPVWGRYVHGTNARRISEIDVVSARNMAWIGVAGWMAGEPFDAIQGNGGAIFTSEDCHSLGVSEVARRAAEHAADGCDAIYLTLAFDFLDAGFFPGAGSVVNNAVTPTHLVEILQVLGQWPIGAMDIAEVSPVSDPSGRSACFAAELILAICGPRFAAGATP